MICGIIAAIFVLIIAGLGITVGAIWGNEISTVTSIKMLYGENEENRGAPVYEMNVKGGYYFNEFIEKGGASNDQELINFIVDNLTKGIINSNMLLIF